MAGSTYEKIQPNLNENSFMVNNDVFYFMRRPEFVLNNAPGFVVTNGNN